MPVLRELAVAVALDLAVGEPPSRVHPVTGMGRLIDLLEDRLPPPGSRGDLLAGGAAWAAGLLLVLALARIVARLPWWARGVALWPLLSWRMLMAEARGVEQDLATAGLEAGRARVGGLVSRPVDSLDVTEVRMAAVESLAENLSDAVVAPLAWWAVVGLPGAAAYRWVNTMDARWGYRTPTWNRRGRVAARADDVVNLVPARLTAVLLVPGLAGRWGQLRAEARRTPSPNAGWPMAAMALALGVRLAERGPDRRHPHGRMPDRRTVPAACRRAAGAGAAAVAFAGLAARWREA